MGVSNRLSRVSARARGELSSALHDPQARAALPGRLRRLAARYRTRVPTHPPEIDIPEFSVPHGPITRPNLRVAVILDPFSTLAFGFEWDQDPVPRVGWREHLQQHRPDLLFVESAWVGNDRAWRLSMTGTTGLAQELTDLVRWCHSEDIPTVFWNKEDPPNYDVFVATARLFDHVFTVDADRIPAYREDLGHDRVALLPFAAQPRIHSPVRHGKKRLGRVAFAGTYFAEKHPDRRRQMDILLAAAKDHGLQIFSRMQGKDPRYRFPPAFASAVVGSLTYRQMLFASTGYEVFLNVNSVTASPTMCSRRLFELSAAQASVLSTPSAAIEPYFGDTVTVATDVDEARTALKVLLGQPEVRDRLALRAHRCVFDTHLYTHRVSEVLQVVGLSNETPVEPTVSAIVPTMRPQHIDSVLATVARQSHRDVELVLVPHGFEVDEDDLRRKAAALGLHQVVVVAASADITLGACMNLGVSAASGRYVTKMDDDNTYTTNYVKDLVRAFTYSDATVVGKWAHYVHLAASGATALRFADAEHRFVRLVQGGTITTARETALAMPFLDVPRAVDTTFLDRVRREGGKVYSADRFNFVSRRARSTAGHTWGITDDELMTRGSRVLFYGDPTEHVDT